MCIYINVTSCMAQSNYWLSYNLNWANLVQVENLIKNPAALVLENSLYFLNMLFIPIYVRSFWGSFAVAICISFTLL